MSIYTTEVRYICETMAGYDVSQGFSKIDEILDKAVPKVFDFEWPIFDEEYRVPLEKKILRYFYTREIGCETYGLWKLMLQNKLCEIMPYYNQLYKSELLMAGVNPLTDVDYTKSGNRTDEGADTRTTEREGTDNTETTATSKDVKKGTTSGKDSTSVYGNQTHIKKYSDTPQGTLTGVENGTYLTEAEFNTDSDDTNTTITTSGTEDVTDQVDSSGSVKNTTTGNENSKGTTNNTAEYLEKVTGKMGGTSYAKLLRELRESFLNIDRDILNDLGVLFMNIW
jgi:hypothetical protein